MKVVINGITVETKEIWRIESIYGNPSYNNAGIRIGIIDKEVIEIITEYNKDTNGLIIQAAQDKYDFIKQALIKLWDQEPNPNPTFDINIK